MPLLNDYSRCNGDNGTICPRRETCQRYLDRGTGGERTLYYPIMCDGEVYLYYIPVVKDEN